MTLDEIHVRLKQLKARKAELERRLKRSPMRAGEVFLDYYDEYLNLDEETRKRIEQMMKKNDRPGFYAAPPLRSDDRIEPGGYGSPEHMRMNDPDIGDLWFMENQTVPGNTYRDYPGPSPATLREVIDSIGDYFHRKKR